MENQCLKDPCDIAYFEKDNMNTKEREIRPGPSERIGYVSGVRDLKIGRTHYGDDDKVSK